jgi:predicted CoA-substrate-specific enzyme activase
MIKAGIDIGSRTVKLVTVADGEIMVARKAQNTYNPVAVAKMLLEGISYDRLTATGYGRHIIKKHIDCDIVSEIKAFASGVRAVFPECRAVLDIGGQDTKTSALSVDGRVLKFEMNDKCAAGTGRFIEVMANAMDFSIEDFGVVALQAESAAKITNMCTVFAESEVISLINNGAKRDEVALGIHDAITRRVLTMLGRLPAFQNLVFAGGVARNVCIRHLLQQNLKIPVLVPDDPQIIGALGAALSNEVTPEQLPIFA